MNTQGPAANDLAAEATQLSDIGRKRSNNEDWAEYYEPDDPTELATSGRLYVVADGVGGAADGQRASQYAAKKILYEYYESTEPDLGDRLRLAIKAANADIYAHTENSQSGNPMGTTVVAAIVRGRELIVANVGDSRAYYIHGSQVQQITRDHSLVQKLLDEGEITPEEAANFKRKNVIMRSVGSDEYVDVDIFRHELAPGDLLLLCTDGLHKYFPEAGELAQLATAGDSKHAARRLVEQANARGGSDNVSVLIVRLREPAPAGAMAKHAARVSSPIWDDMPTARVLIKPGRLAVALGGRRSGRWKTFGLLVGVALFLLASFMVVALVGPRLFGSVPTSTTVALTLFTTPTAPIIRTTGTGILTGATKTATLNAVVLTHTTLVGDETATPPTVEDTQTIPTTTTQIPSSTPALAANGLDKAGFLQDVTIPDDTSLAAGEIFTKTWQLKNVGTSTWTTGYVLLFSSGDRMVGGDVPVTLTATIAPGDIVEISIVLTAPAQAGKYSEHWMLHNEGNIAFGTDVWVKIEVVTPSPAPNGLQFRRQRRRNL